MKRFRSLPLLLLALLVSICFSSPAFAAQSKDMQGLMDALRQLDPKAAQQIEDLQAASAPSEAGLRAQEEAMSKVGVITVVDKDSGVVLKTLEVNPVEAIASSQGGDLFVEILNPARLNIWLQNRVLPDLYEYEGQFPQTRKGANLFVGAQFSGTRFGGTCDFTIVGHNDNVFKFQLSNGAGTFYDANNKTTPALASGTIEATYIGKR